MRKHSPSISNFTASQFHEDSEILGHVLGDGAHESDNAACAMVMFNLQVRQARKVMHSAHAW